MSLSLEISDCYAEVLSRCAQFAHKFARIGPALISHIVVGDEAAGIEADLLTLCSQHLLTVPEPLSSGIQRHSRLQKPRSVGVPQGVGLYI